MATILTDQGPLVETLDENEETLDARFVDEFGSEIDTTEQSYTGREIKILSRSFVEIQNLTVAAVGALSPDDAQGRYLDNGAGQLLREPRKGATSSTIAVRLFGVPGTAVGDLRVRYKRNDSQWRTPQTLPNEVTELEIGASGVVDVTITATETGVVTAGQDGTQEWIIVDEVTGWDANTGAVESLADSVDGLPREGDPDYRVRLRLAGRASGLATEPGVQRSLLKVPGMVSVRTLPNRGLVVDANGVAGKTVEAIVEGGTDADWGKAILESYGGSDGTQGSTEVEVLDALGNLRKMRFTRVQRIDLIIEVRIDTTTTDLSAPPLPDNAQNTVIGVVSSRVNGLAEGVDVLPDDLEGQVRNAFEGGAIPENGVTVSIGLKGGLPPANAPFVIATRQRARTNAEVQPAEIIGTETQTFVFDVNWVLDIAVNDSNAQRIEFSVGDFASTGAATTLEIAAAIEKGSTGITAGSEQGALVMRTNTLGATSKLGVLGSTSPALLLELGLNFGSTLGSNGDISVEII